MHPVSFTPPIIGNEHDDCNTSGLFMSLILKCPRLFNSLNQDAPRFVRATYHRNTVKTHHQPWPKKVQSVIRGKFGLILFQGPFRTKSIKLERRKKSAVLRKWKAEIVLEREIHACSFKILSFPFSYLFLPSFPRNQTTSKC